MSTTFTKLFSSITESTIWVEDHETRILWITMLAMSDRHGRVWGSIPGIANRARISDAGARHAIKLFLSPDPDSRTQVAEGRRIEAIDGGWRLINHQKYRDIRDAETVRAQTADRVRAHREKKRNVTDVTPRNANADADADAEAYTEDPPSEDRAKRPPAKRSTQLPDDFTLTAERADFFMGACPGADNERLTNDWSQFSDHHRSRGSTMKDWDAAWRTWCRNSVKFNQRGNGNGRQQESPLERVQRAYEAEQRRASVEGVGDAD